MAETDVHRDEMLALIESLKDHFRDELDVYVAGNNFIYYEQGNPRAVFSPDTYVVFGVEKKQRRIYKLWEEYQPPSFVMEMSSRKTIQEDVGKKKALCARLGVREYFLYDPEAEVLEPPLQGFYLVENAVMPEYRRIEPNEDGSVASKVLGLLLRLEDDLTLRCIHARTGKPLRRPREVRDAARGYDEATRRHDEVVRQRDDVTRQRDEVVRQRDDVTRQRDDVAQQFDSVTRERDDALALVAAAEARDQAARRKIEQLTALLNRDDE